MQRAILLPLALRELIELREFIGQESGSLLRARQFTQRIREHCDKVAALPGTLGRRRDELAPELRSLAWQNYVILFRYVDRQLVVVRILDGRRNIPALFAPDPES